VIVHHQAVVFVYFFRLCLFISLVFLLPDLSILWHGFALGNWPEWKPSHCQLPKEQQWHGGQDLKPKVMHIWSPAKSQR